MIAVESTSAVAALVSRLSEALPDDAISTAASDLATCARDSAPFSEAGTPAVVVRPTSTEQVRHVLRTASLLGVPVVPQGARTGLAGGANAVDGCVVLSTVRMDRILSIDPSNRLLRCEPGVPTARLSEAVEAYGLCYPPDPASHETCTIGGNIATDAGGLCCVKYGVTGDYVLGLEVVLADGSLLRTGHDTVKGVAGYDLTSLFVGSEGTLGVIVEATLALRPVPPPGLALLAQFASTVAAGAAVSAIVEAGHQPSALELLDATTGRAIADLGHPLFSGDAEATLIVESDAPDRSTEIAGIALLCSEAGALTVAMASSEDEAGEVLEARRLVLPALAARAARLPGETVSFIEDVCVPRSEIAAFLDRIALIAHDHDLEIATIGHAGDGNLHPAVIFDRTDPSAVHRAEEAYDSIMAAGLALGGTITGEHGIGLLKRDWLGRELDPVALRMQHAIKDAFDPQGILNPGKVLPPRVPEQREAQ